MASSSSSSRRAFTDSDSDSDDVPMWSVARLKRFLAGYHEVQGILREKLVAAAVATLTRKNCILAFREYCFVTKESHGRLYELVKRLAPPPEQDASHANPYADFKLKHPEVPLPEKLDFLLEEYRKERMPCNLDYDLGLSDTDAERLSAALRDKRIPEWLLQACSFLTFEENLDCRVQVARLWIEGAQLPIFFGSSITFEELKKMEKAPDKPADLPLEDDLPSTILCQVREETIDGYRLRNELGWKVIHPLPSELPDGCSKFARDLAKQRWPVLVDSYGGLRITMDTGDPALDNAEYNESVMCQLRELKYSETPRMFKLFARLFFDLER